jgi:hypothetical protein
MNQRTKKYLAISAFLAVVVIGLLLFFLKKKNKFSALGDLSLGAGLFGGAMPDDVFLRLNPSGVVYPILPAITLATMENYIITLEGPGQDDETTSLVFDTSKATIWDSYDTVGVIKFTSTEGTESCFQPLNFQHDQSRRGVYGASYYPTTEANPDSTCKQNGQELGIIVWFNKNINTDNYNMVWCFEDASTLTPLCIIIDAAVPF